MMISFKCVYCEDNIYLKDTCYCREIKLPKQMEENK